MFCEINGLRQRDRLAIGGAVLDPHLTVVFQL